MMTPPLDPAVIAAVERALAAGGASQATIAKQFGVSTGSVSKINLAMRAAGKFPSSTSTAPVANGLPSHEAIRKSLRRGGKTESELADDLDCSPKVIRQAIAEMRAGGAMLTELHGRYELTDSMHLERGESVISSKAAERKFGVLGDNHLCNKHSRLDVLKAAYDHFEREGITDVFNTGNWIDGEARFNKTELIVAPGMDRQIDYMIQEYPQRKGITTHYIAGDDHEGWYQQREGVEIGRYLQMKAQDAGRDDLKYLGYGECDVRLAHGSGEAVMRVVHPGGGSSYAISYTDQKRVESYQGGEKPQIELAGHYHKYAVGYPREVHTVQTGCTCDQTMFMRKKRLQAHVGFLTVSLRQDSRGAVDRFSVEWFPFFDRGYYEKRFVL